MMRLFSFICLFLIAPWPVCRAAVPDEKSLPPVRLGVVIDGPWERNDEIFDLFKHEITALLSGEFDVQIPGEHIRLGDWSLENIKAAVDDLLADPGVDFLLTLGPIASAYACEIPGLSKPVIAPFILDHQIQGIPYIEGTSGVKNLNYVAFESRFHEDMKVYLEVVPFKHITFLVSKALHTIEPEVSRNLSKAIELMGLKTTIVPVGESVEEALSAIPPETGAVFLVPLRELPPGDWDRLVAGLIERKLPAFSFWGDSEVERGVFLSLFLDTDFQRMARRVALNMQRILLGEEAGSLPVIFRRSRRMTINMETARAIGIYPNWAVMTEAVLLDEKRKDLERQLTLSTTVKEALAANLDLAAGRRRVAAGAQVVREARSNLFPQVEVSGTGRLIDKDRAEASFGSQPQKSFAGAASITQVIYSDPVLSNIEIQRHLQNAREMELEQIRLDIVLEAAVAYLDVLRAKTFEGIQKNNLRLTLSNLELARVRRDVGVSGPAEVYRWESQTATNRRAVIRSSAQRNQAEIALNRLLHRPVEEGFLTEEEAYDDLGLMEEMRALYPYTGNPWGFRVFRDFMVREALAESPELAQLDAAIEAQERVLTSTHRVFWSPTVAMQGEVSGIAKSGSGSDMNLGDVFPPGMLPEADDINWSFGLNISLPIFQGGRRWAESSRAAEELAELKLLRQAAAERVEQRIRSALHQAGASWAGIDLAEDAAKAAGKNLELVTDAYSRGVVSILDLLDAQNAALVAEQEAADAIYDNLIDYLNVQRAAGRFSFSRTSDEREAFFNRLETFFKSSEIFPTD